MTPDLPRATLLAAELARIIPTIPNRWDDRPGYQRGIDALERAVAKADPKGALTEDWRGGLIRACGLRATSTSGAINACRNWIRQVEQLSGAPVRQTSGEEA